MIPRPGSKRKIRPATDVGSGVPGVESKRGVNYHEEVLIHIKSDALNRFKMTTSG